jgi:hypothetical protein
MSSRRTRTERSRDELISLARYGKVTSAEAEAEATAKGWPPFERRPSLPQFDPMAEPRWSLVMIVAWIAWRDLSLVREQNAGFRGECTHWIFREWQGPSDDGMKFERHAGWFLEPWSKATIARLSLFDRLLKNRAELPPARQMAVREAEIVLWRALSEGRLTAVGVNEAGRPVDIPERDWPYLKIYEEREADVLKFAALDPAAAYGNVSFKREDVLRLWPAVTYERVPLVDDGLIDPSMLQPMSVAGTVGLIPLCSALQWIMTKGGTLRLAINDEPAWNSACDRLLPLIHEGQIELIGVRAGASAAETIPGHTLALVKVHAPLDLSYLSMVSDAPVFISCTPFVDKEHWRGDFHDRLFFSDRPGAGYTHLQVRKSQILQHWPRPTARMKPQQDCFQWLLSEMHNSPSSRPKSKQAFRAEAKVKFSPLTERQFNQAWALAALESGAMWSKSGRPKSSKSNQNGK